MSRPRAKPPAAPTITTFAKRVDFLVDWCRRDREFGWKQTLRDEEKYPGVKDAVTERMQQLNRSF